jgi:hypothetical protein
MFLKFFGMNAWFCLIVMTGLAGCRSQGESSLGQEEAQADTSDSDVSPHADTANFRATLADIQAMKSEICKAFADGTPDDAHDALHEVGHSLEELPGLAAKEGDLTAEQLSAVETAVEALFDGFGELDGTLHGGGEVDIKELEEKLSQALEKLEEVVQ